AAAAPTTKAPGVQQINAKDKASPNGFKPTGNGPQRTMTTDDEQYSRVKEPSEMVDTKDQGLQ
ncbi:unnamed protein product, partial [Rotaria magnacalcarata]